MKIAIGNDHAGTTYKHEIVKFLTEQGHQVLNFGTDTDQSVDYPDFAHKVGKSIQEKQAELGIVICGSGNGIAMSVNKHSDVRCAVCWNKEITQLARQHNNANVMSIPARFTAKEQAIEMVKTFLETPFEGGRHQQRVNKISCM